jgi:hypothetical protein
MPLTLTLTEGVLPRGAEAQAVQQLTDAMLERHGLTPPSLKRRPVQRPRD